MKYIVTLSETGVEEMFIFSSDINHDTMAESVGAMRDRSQSPWRRIRRNPVSAGFIEGGRCTGYSETLKMGAREEDNKLLAQFLKS